MNATGRDGKPKAQPLPQTPWQICSPLPCLGSKDTSLKIVIVSGSSKVIPKIYKNRNRVLYNLKDERNKTKASDR